MTRLGIALTTAMVRLAVFAAMAGPLAQDIWAEEPAETDLFESLEAAYASGDAAAMAALWSESGIYAHLDTGERAEGRAAIKDLLHPAFQSAEAREIDIRILLQREFSDDLRQVEGHARTISGTDKRISDSLFVAVLKREDGRWRIDTLHERDGAPPDSITPTEDPLAFLEPLLGVWEDDNATLEVRSTLRRSERGRYILKEHTVTERATGDVLAKGTIVVGYDAGQNSVRCWQFEADGTLGEGLVTPVEGGVRLSINHTLPDGTRASGVHVLTLTDADTCTSRTFDQTIDGQSIEDIGETIIRRVGPDQVGGDATAKSQGSDSIEAGE